MFFLRKKKKKKDVYTQEIGVEENKNSVTQKIC